MHPAEVLSPGPGPARAAGGQYLRPPGGQARARPHWQQTPSALRALEPRVSELEPRSGAHWEAQWSVSGRGRRQTQQLDGPG